MDLEPSGALDMGFIHRDLSLWKFTFSHQKSELPFHRSGTLWNSGYGIYPQRFQLMETQLPLVKI